MVVRHSHSFGSSSEDEQSVFQLNKNGPAIALCYGSSWRGSMQSSTLHNIILLQKFGVLSVVYSGTYSTRKDSYITIFKVE